MTDTPDLDRAIEAGENATDITWKGDVRAFSRALVAELLRGMDEPPLDPPAILGWDLAIQIIKRRAGLEGETIEPLPTDFAKVWDDNPEGLYQP